jgi:iron complex outermembrane recepter protein
MGINGSPGRRAWGWLCGIGVGLSVVVPGLEAQTVLAPVVVSGHAELPQGDELRLRGEALDLQRSSAQAGTLAGALAAQPGVAQSWLGPQASRPLLRGQEGERVRLVDDGAALHDASGLSADHAVPVDVLTLDQLELIRGPQALRWGGSPLAGVVHSRSARLPLERPEGLSGVLAGQTGTQPVAPSAPGWLSGSLDYGRDDGHGDWAVHLDGQHRKAPDYATPRGRVSNSAARNDSGGVGAAWSGEHLRLGFSADALDSHYGVIADPAVTIRLYRQHQRWVAMSAEGSVERPGWLLQFDRSDYHHEEIDGDGSIGTAFKHAGSTLRFERRLSAAAESDWLFGLEYEQADFEAQGAEAYVPGTRTRRAGAFAIGSGRVTASRLDWSAALRLDQRQLDGQGDAWGSASRFGVAHAERHEAGNLSVELGAPLAGQRVALRLSRLERAPSAAELHADGVHFATASYERGDPNLSTELGRAIELTVDPADTERAWHLSLWQADYGRYLLQRATGRDVLVTDDQGVAVPWAEYATTAVAARLTGLEAQRRWSWHSAGSGRWTLATQLNGLAGRDLERSEPLPRLAPWQLRSTLEQQSGPWQALLIWTLTARQSQVPADDVPTAGWGMIDLRLQRRLGAESDRLTATLALDNAGNVAAANASTMRTLREVALLPARTLSVSLRWKF